MEVCRGPRPSLLSNHNSSLFVCRAYGYRLLSCFDGLCLEDLDDPAVDSLQHVPADGSNDCREAYNVGDIEN